MRSDQERSPIRISGIGRSKNSIPLVYYLKGRNTQVPITAEFIFIIIPISPGLNGLCGIPFLASLATGKLISSTDLKKSSPNARRMGEKGEL